MKSTLKAKKKKLCTYEYPSYKEMYVLYWGKYLLKGEVFFVFTVLYFNLKSTYSVKSHVVQVTLQQISKIKKLNTF